MLILKFFKLTRGNREEVLDCIQIQYLCVTLSLSPSSSEVEFSSFSSLVVIALTCVWSTRSWRFRPPWWAKKPKIESHRPRCINWKGLSMCRAGNLETTPQIIANFSYYKRCQITFPNQFQVELRPSIRNTSIGLGTFIWSHSCNCTGRPISRLR